MEIRPATQHMMITRVITPTCGIELIRGQIVGRVVESVREHRDFSPRFVDP